MQGWAETRKWTSFTNPARNDGLVLNHWRRVADEGQQYPFAKFDKSVSVPSYTEQDYKKYLADDGWTKEETDWLFELCQQFDLRFPVVHDKYNSWAVKRRSIEELKERYYSVCNRIQRVSAKDADSIEHELMAYDADHEKRRKEQLERLYSRTREQVEEEEMLLAELKKIELRKKEREKKQQDLQKLITAAEHTAEAGKKYVKKTTSSKIKKSISTTPKQFPDSNPGVFKSFDKSSGVTLRGNKMKMPVTIGQKKAKLIEQLLEEMGVDLHPMPTEEICVQFNELRNDILLLLDLKAGCDACDFEFQSLKHRHEALPPEKQGCVTLPEITASPKQQVSATLPLMEAASLSARKRRTAGLESPFKKKKS
jgi:DNA methyltransferase 1-associated protein 1